LFICILRKILETFFLFQHSDLEGLIGRKLEKLWAQDAVFKIFSQTFAEATIYIICWRDLPPHPSSRTICTWVSPLVPKSAMDDRRAKAKAKAKAGNSSNHNNNAARGVRVSEESRGGVTP